MSRPARTTPDRRVERTLLRTYALVGGMDEVGRGSLAGPVTIGLAIVSDDTIQTFPPGLADSKQLTARRREELVAPCRTWLTDHAVAHASPREIDVLGIIGALRLAGRRALAQVASRGHLPGAVILDGSTDWLSCPDDGQPGFPLLTDVGGLPALDAGLVPPVRTEVRGDARCAVVAAASVLAKVERDALMVGLPDPGYDWASNKGYASAAHVAGLARLGAAEQHRRSWRLPGLGSTGTPSV